MTLYTPDRLLEMGLELAGFDLSERQCRVKRDTNMRRFKSHYIVVIFNYYSLAFFSYTKTCFICLSWIRAWLAFKTSQKGNPLLSKIRYKRTLLAFRLSKKFLAQFIDFFLTLKHSSPTCFTSRDNGGVLSNVLKNHRFPGPVSVYRRLRGSGTVP
jgi:hypothetical protein